MNIYRAALLLIACFTLFACAQQVVEPPAQEPVYQEPVVTKPAPRPPPVEPRLTPEQERALRLQQLLSQKVIYFDFDRSEIRPESRDIVAAHAMNLAQNRQFKVLLEGHADERGSREYNIGLGERRAQSVRRALMAQGVSADQLSTISYGEERPANPGHNESAWQENRRVVFVYR